LTGNERAQYVQAMFTRIAPRYDLMNRIMTGGQDGSWRREVIRLARIPKGGWVLDLGAGTGDLAGEALRQSPECRPAAVDFTLEMMRVGKLRPNAPALGWSQADGRYLPFPDDTFEAVVSGFLLRNVPDVPMVLGEMLRVLRPGGRMVALDTTPPPDNLLAPFIRFHLDTVIPTLGTLIAGQADAYQYLPDSTRKFLEPEQLAARMQNAGFEQVAYQRRMFGTIAIHSGVKPE
jgi:demethylmenaquinone methyltransferase/2-methoxy-6-polyprenyl-1,4-benzoquinol methylase